MDKLKVAFSVDDVSCAKGFGGMGNQGPLGFLTKLNEEFGCRFDLFTVPNFQGQANILESPEWCEWLQGEDQFKVQAHGVFHQNTKNQRYQHMELAGLNPQEFQNVVKQSKDSLEKAGFSPEIFKAPGWEFPQFGYKLIKEDFDYLADHLMSDQTFTLSNELTLIPYTRLGHKLHSIPSGDQMVIHTHINPQGGQNGFTKELYEYISNYLGDLEQSRDVEYVFMTELE